MYYATLSEKEQASVKRIKIMKSKITKKNEEESNADMDVHATLSEKEQAIEEEWSGDRLEIHYKTSSKATIAVFILRFRNRDKKDD